VHFAARQLSGNAGTAISSSSINSESIVDGLGLGRTAARAADDAFCAADQNLHDCRTEVTRFATRSYRYEQQYDPDTGEPLFDEQRALQGHEITKVLESLCDELHMQSGQALMRGMTVLTRQQLLQPAGFRQLRARREFGLDAGAEVVSRHLESWGLIKSDEAAEGSELRRAVAALVTDVHEVNEGWLFTPMRLTQVGGYCECCSC
jgi:hypothetical protein